MAEMLTQPALRLRGDRATKIDASRGGAPSRPDAGHDSAASLLWLGLRRHGPVRPLARADGGVDRVDHARRRRPFLRHVLQPAHDDVAIAGDVSDSAALDAATRAFGAWRPRGEPSSVDMARSQRPASHPHVCAATCRAPAKQAYLYVGELGPSRIDPDAVATDAFAAVASARLQEALREKRSFIYSSTTGITWRRARARGDVRRQHDRQRAEGRQRAHRVVADPA